MLVEPRRRPVWPINPAVGSRKLKLALAADCGRITRNSDVTRLGKGCRK